MTTTGSSLTYALSLAFEGDVAKLSHPVRVRNLFLAFPPSIPEAAEPVDDFRDCESMSVATTYQSVTYFGLLNLDERCVTNELTIINAINTVARANTLG